MFPPLNLASECVPVEDFSDSAHGRSAVGCVVEVAGAPSAETFGSMVSFSPRQSSNRPSTSRDGLPLPDSMLLSV